MGQVVGSRPATRMPAATVPASRRQGDGDRHGRLQGLRAGLFKTGRDVVVDGRLRNGVFVAVPNTLVTKCPSKYTTKDGRLDG